MIGEHQSITDWFIDVDEDDPIHNAPKLKKGATIQVSCSIACFHFKTNVECGEQRVAICFSHLALIVMALFFPFRLTLPYLRLWHGLVEWLINCSSKSKWGQWRKYLRISMIICFSYILSKIKNVSRFVRISDILLLS